MKIWFDTEFIEDGKTIELISIGAVREDGQTYYAICADTDMSRASLWVRENVLPKLGEAPWISKEKIAHDMVLFAGDNPEFWAYYADYDWVALCQLYGPMINLPEGWPMFCLDLMQLRSLADDVPLPVQQHDKEHNALEDALWTKDAWERMHVAIMEEEVTYAWQVCPICGGEGKISAPQISAGSTQCPTCRGTRIIFRPSE